MRVLFTTQPGLGHFHPLVPIAQALVAAGHDVAVACPATFASHVRAAGLAHLPAGPDWVESDLVATFPALRALPATADPWHTSPRLPGSPDILVKTRQWSNQPVSGAANREPGRLRGPR